MAIRYEVLSAPSLRDRLQVLSKRLFEVDATPRNLPPLVANAAKCINDAGFLFDGSSDGRDRWPAGWEGLWPFNMNDRWLLQWLVLSKDVDYAREELESPTAEVDRDTVLAWLQAAFASHLQQWLSQCVPEMSLNPGSAFVPSEWRGKFGFRKYHWKHQRNLAASAKLIGPSEYRQFADDVATACAYLSQQLTEWLTVTESPAPIAPALPSLVAPKGEGTPGNDRQPVVEVKPKVYLSGWPDILDAVGRKNIQTEKNSVLGLNERFDGPIPKVGKGSKPLVEKSTLLNWWNGLEDQFREIDASQKNKAATVAEQYQYGRDATVFPGIGGHEKKSQSKKG